MFIGFSFFYCNEEPISVPILVSDELLIGDCSNPKTQTKTLLQLVPVGS